MFDDSAPFATAFFYKYGQQATTAPQFFWDGTTVAARQHEGRGKEGERTEGSGGESGTHFADGGRGRADGCSWSVGRTTTTNPRSGARFPSPLPASRFRR